MLLQRKTMPADVLGRRVLYVGFSLNFNRKILMLMLLVLLSTVVLEIWISSRISTFGSKIFLLNQEESDLQLQNQLLQNEIATSSSLNEVSKAAQLLGLEDIRHLEYIEPLGLAFSENIKP